MRKNWILYFDEKNYNPCGSDGSIPTDYSQNTIDKKIKTKEIYVPNWATTYIVLPNVKFLNMNYDEIHKYHSNYAKNI